MVLKGQFLERPTIIPVGDEVMEGLSHRGARRPPLLIVPPRPEDGSGMDHVVAAEVAWAVAMAGHPTLRFNFRGVGASQGRRGDSPAQLQDIAAALQLAAENAGSARVALLAIGGSAGSALALQRSLQGSREGLCGLALVSPVGLDFPDLSRLPVPLLVVVGQLDVRIPRAALAAAVAGAGGTFEVVPGTDAAFHRNLPEVGKVVEHWLRNLSGAPGV